MQSLIARFVQLERSQLLLVPIRMLHVLLVCQANTVPLQESLTSLGAQNVQRANFQTHLLPQPAMLAWTVLPVNIRTKLAMIRRAIASYVLPVRIRPPVD
jgi:hypothetical protein